MLRNVIDVGSNIFNCLWKLFAFAITCYKFFLDNR